MNKKLKLSHAELNFGANLAIKNAISLYDSAEKISVLGKYGHASSLLVLSSEEAVKSIVLFSFSVGLEVDPDGIEQYFSRHTIKHQTLRYLVFVEEWLTTYKDSTTEAYSLMENQDVTGFVNSIKIYAEKIINNPSKKYLEMKKWLVNANNLKNSGLYVDLKNDGVWKAPGDINKEQYVESRTLSMDLINMARLGRIICNRYSGDESIKNLATMFKAFTNKIDSLAEEVE